MDLSMHYNVIRILILDGVLPTLRLMPLAIGLSLLIGFIGGFLRIFKIPILNQIIVFFVNIVRGTPIIIIFFFSYFVVHRTDQDPFRATVTALVVCNAAFLVEIVRGGLEGINKGQTEAAISLGMTRLQSLIYIILPQAILLITPALIGQLILLVKATAAASVIGYIEITRKGMNLMQTLRAPLPIFSYVGIIYFVLCHFLKIIADRIEGYTSMKIIGSTKVKK